MNTKVKIWLDDERSMPSFYNYHAKTAKECIDKIKEGGVVFISLDHDLGDGNGTGYDVAKFIEEAAFNNSIEKITTVIHSQNSIGRENMRQALLNARRFWNNRGE